jgi:hypothetical protein
MGLLNKLTQEGSNLSEFDGATPPPANIDVQGSTLTQCIFNKWYSKL